MRAIDINNPNPPKIPETHDISYDPKTGAKWISEYIGNATNDGIEWRDVPEWVCYFGELGGNLVVANYTQYMYASNRRKTFEFGNGNFDFEEFELIDERPINYDE